VYCILLLEQIADYNGSVETIIPLSHQRFVRVYYHLCIERIKVC